MLLERLNVSIYCTRRGVPVHVHNEGGIKMEGEERNYEEMQKSACMWCLSSNTSTLLNPRCAGEAAAVSTRPLVSHDHASSVPAATRTAAVVLARPSAVAMRRSPRRLRHFEAPGAEKARVRTCTRRKR